jgi:hypothetical protein
MKPYGVKERMDWLKTLLVWRTRKERHKIRRSLKRVERQLTKLELKKYTN